MTSKPNELPRWRRTPEERPRQILDAALDVFGEQGLAGARIDDIADRAGISKGTIYLYFASKDELFKQVVRDGVGEVLEVVTSIEETDDPEADLKRFCKEYFSFLRTKRFESVYRLIMSQMHSFPELSLEYASEVREPIREIVSDILDRGTKAGQFQKGNNPVRARMLLALLWQHGIWCAKREVYPDLADRSDSAVLKEVVTFFLEAIANER